MNIQQFKYMMGTVAETNIETKIDPRVLSSNGANPGAILQVTAEGNVEWKDPDPIDTVYPLTSNEKKLIREIPAIKDAYAEMMVKMLDYKLLIKLYSDSEG